MNINAEKTALKYFSHLFFLSLEPNETFFEHAMELYDRVIILVSFKTFFCRTKQQIKTNFQRKKISVFISKIHDKKKI